jgi:hypothetical protein
MKYNINDSVYVHIKVYSKVPELMFMFEVFFRLNFQASC